jgi:hypothetical protein
MTELTSSNFHFAKQSTILTLSIGGKDIEIADFVSIDNGKNPKQVTMRQTSSGKDFIVYETNLTQPRVIVVTFEVLGLDELKVLNEGIKKRELVDLSIVDTSNGKTIQGTGGVPIEEIPLPMIAEDIAQITLTIQFATNNYFLNV